MNRPSEQEAIESYFKYVRSAQAKLAESKATDGLHRRLLKNLVPRSRRGTVRVLATRVIMPLGRRRARGIESTTHPLKLHLGSGGEHKDGWVNVDLVGDPVEFSWDLSRGIPFSDSSADEIFHEHLLEHIPLEAGYGFMRECYRVLAPTGILRVAVPDAGSLAQSYVTKSSYLPLLHGHSPTAMIGLQELFYWHRHTTMYDAETLQFLFKASGFSEPRICPFSESDMATCPDTPTREDESLYVECRK